MQKKVDLASVRHSLAGVAVALGSANMCLAENSGPEAVNSIKNLVRLSSERVLHLISQIDQETGRLAGVQIPVSHTESGGTNPPDAVLIDDCPMVRQSWSVFFRKRGKLLCAFASASEFDAVRGNFHKTTPLYIDLDLGNGENGLNVSSAYFELGFKNIYLATGHQLIESMPSYLSGVIGKIPPDL